jgi:hypothetical protein
LRAEEYFNVNEEFDAWFFSHDNGFVNSGIFPENYRGTGDSGDLHEERFREDDERNVD